MADRKTSRRTKSELDSLSKIQIGLEELPDQYRNAFNPWRQLFFNYLKGIIYGLGFLSAFAIVAPLLLWFLNSIQWVPMIGHFVTQVALQVQQASSR